MIYESPASLSQLSQPITEVACSPPPQSKKPKLTWLRILQRQLLAALLLGCTVFSFKYWWPPGYEAAKEHFVCQELGPIQKAGCIFVGQVLNGEPVPEALAAFSTTIFEGILCDDEAAS